MTEPSFTLGVEEEYQIVDPESRELVPVSPDLVPAARASAGDAVQPELYRSQVEIGTPVARSLEEVRRDLKALRGRVMGAAEAKGHRIAAAGTHPFSHWSAQEISPKDRYEGLLDDFQQLAKEQIIFGCHVHVGIEDPEEAILTMDRTRASVAPILALAANSPFWLGRDSGYASFGREMWRRWPMAGVPPRFGSRESYDRLIEVLVSAGAIKDATKIYWDIRPSARYSTIEFRVTDVCMEVDEAVMLAGLFRALAKTCHRAAVDEEEELDVPPQLLAAANWRASRFGLEGELVDLDGGELTPAPRLVRALLARLRPALEQDEAWDEVEGLVERTLRDGNGAMRQRTAFQRAGRLEDVVDLVVDATRGERNSRHG